MATSAPAAPPPAALLALIAALKADSSIPLALSLPNQEEHIRAHAIADQILEAVGSSATAYGDLRALATLLVSEEGYQTALHLATRLAMSKIQLQKSAPSRVTMIVPMYKEANRMKSKEEHPAGEDFIRAKARESRWLFDGAADGFDWELVFVDDGCPVDSATLAKDLIATLPEDDQRRLHVIKLQDAIDQKIPMFADIKSTNDSQKGGSCQYAMWWAIDAAKKAGQFDSAVPHFIGFTDSDLSTNLGQTGLLLYDLTVNGAHASVGMRYGNPLALTCDDRGPAGMAPHDIKAISIRDWAKRVLLPPLAPVLDTQCGFKLFRATTLDKVLGQANDRKFSFDMELLLLTDQEARRAGGVAADQETIGAQEVVHVFSAEESNFYSANTSSDTIARAELVSSLRSYYSMCHRMQALRKRFAYSAEEGEEQARVKFITELSFDQYFALATKIDQLTGGVPLIGTNFKLSDLVALAEGCEHIEDDGDKSRK